MERGASRSFHGKKEQEKRESRNPKKGRRLEAQTGFTAAEGSAKSLLRKSTIEIEASIALEGRHEERRKSGPTRKMKGQKREAT